MRARRDPFVLLLVAAVAASMALPRRADAFCRTTTCQKEGCATDEDGCTMGTKLWWPKACLGFSLQKDGTQFLGMADVRVPIHKAFAAWSDVDCGGGKRATMTFTAQADVACKTSRYTKGAANVNVVLFQDNDWKYRDTDSTLAKTTVSFSSVTGEIFDADIEVNTANNNFTVGDKNVEYDLQAVMTHEVGHFIGMAHSPDLDAAMYAAYSPGVTSLRNLSSDDKAAVCAAYPPDRVAACDTSGEVSCTDDPPPPPSSSCAIERARIDKLGFSSMLPVGLAIAAMALLRARARRTTGKP